MEPLFLDSPMHEKIWGGNRLKTEFGYDIPSEHTGEYWAISAHPNGVSYVKNGKYAAHTLNANSRRVGVSLDAMAGATESPFRTGSNPITEVQLDAMARLVADINKACKLKVLRTTNLTHAEVQRTLGIRQNNKWDITWLPGMTKPGDAIEVGDRLRKRISEYM